MCTLQYPIHVACKGGGLKGRQSSFLICCGEGSVKVGVGGKEQNIRPQYPLVIYWFMAPITFLFTLQTSFLKFV